MKKTYLLIGLFCLLGIGTLSAQVTSGFGIGGGISKPTGDGSEYWKMGFNVNAEYLHQVGDVVFVGGRLAYNRWSADGDKVLEDAFGITGYDGGGSVEGTASIIELMPTARFVAPGDGVQFFGQVGLGLYMLKAEMEYDISVSGYGSQSGSSTMDENDFGLEIGGGLIFGNGDTKFSLYPMYHHIATEEEATKYFTVNFGVIFGK